MSYGACGDFYVNDHRRELNIFRTEHKVLVSINVDAICSIMREQRAEACECVRRPIFNGVEHLISIHNLMGVPNCSQTL